MGLFTACLCSSGSYVPSSSFAPPSSGVPTFVSAAIIASAYTAAAMMARYYFAIDVKLRRLRDIVILILTGLVGALVFAILVPLLLDLVGQFDIDDLFPSILSDFIGDAIGIAVVSPLTLRFWYLRRQLTLEFFRSVFLEAAVYAALIAAGLWLIEPAQHGSNFFYLLFLPVIIAAVRQGLDGACLSLLVTQIGLVLLLHRYSFDAATFTEFQAKMFVLTATALTVGSNCQRARAGAACVPGRRRAAQTEGGGCASGRSS